MHTPFLAAGALALALLAGPYTASALKAAGQSADLFAPLRCAMENSGTCNMDAAHRPITDERRLARADAEIED